MLVVISSEKLDFNFALGQPAEEILNGLRSAFIDSQGEETFLRASKVIVTEENFYNVIKDRYGPTLIGEHIDHLYDLIDAHLAI
jgi:hypothetical protein